ncbi:MAG: sigma factor-like helix-turn-helix DNA-binding protein, partial [bacterium]|nr:sigma factor-like helix-turn-helix DNA-binding protein [bacterium]
MAKMPVEWLQHLTRLCVSGGVAHDDAEACACDILLRYHHRRGAYPWDEPTPDEKLLRLLTRNVVAEHLRTLARHRRLEAEYCACLQHTCAPTPMQTAIENADAERCYATLPPYLRRTMELLEEGYTPAEIAEQLGVSVNTVYTYRQELQVHFVKYFGYDPRNRGSRVVNYSGGPTQGLPRPTGEVANDETTQVVVDERVVVSDSEPCGDAPHAGGVERVQRGGGTSLSPVTSSSGGCGCASTSFEKNPDAHSSTLAYSPVQLALPLPAIPCP